MYLSIKFPITTHGKFFQTYKVLSVPVEVNSTNTHATQIFDLPDYFLITHDKQFHTTLTTDSLTNCLGDKTKYCSRRPLFKSTNTSSCVLNLFFNNKLFNLYTSVDTEMCCPKSKCGCQYFILLTLKKKIMDTGVLDFLIKN